ncbi:hypothetical protein V1503_25035 [Bacillus sp. SCS-151]|uniref:hypothetical protein n=1 Tax=Nanhaiella sioensis TaxID=3115293 RepID=UPI00397C9C62
MNDFFLFLFLLITTTYIYTYFSAYIHEFGHYISAKLLGANSAKILFNNRSSNLPRFVTKFNFERKMSVRENIIVTISGVLLQTLVGLSFIIQDHFLMLKVVSCIYLPASVFNILPYNPFDGYYLYELSNRNKYLKQILIIIFSVVSLISISVSIKLILDFYVISPSKGLLILILLSTFLYRLFRKAIFYSRVVNP